MNITEFLEMQRQLQINMREANSTQGGDPYQMSVEQLAKFITWNHTALVVELGEMLNEVGWKPWASSRHCEGDLALREMVDAWHFFLNIMLGISSWHSLMHDGLESPEDVGEFFENYYREKNRKNLTRQIVGYDGVSTKCKSCRRELSETTCTPTHCVDQEM